MKIPLPDGTIDARDRAQLTGSRFVTGGLMTLTIPAVVDYRIGGLWDGLPYKTAAARINDTFGNYPPWRRHFDHDNDPSTPARDMGPHKGIDMSVGLGTPIHAVDDGQVFFIEHGHAVMGNWLMIVHPSAGAGLQPTPATYYLHLDTIAVPSGQKVRRGEQIGTEGTTGASTGPHLHFAVRLSDQWVNPMDYVVPPGTLPPVPAPTPAFTPEPVVEGHTLTLFSGGGEADLMAAMVDYDLTSAGVTRDGAWIMYINGAPAGVNHAFMAVFPGGIPPNTPMMVTK